MGPDPTGRRSTIRTNVLEPIEDLAPRRMVRRSSVLRQSWPEALCWLVIGLFAGYVLGSLR